MTTTYDKLDTINDSLNDIKTAIIGKGQTPSGNITTYATAIDNISQQAAVIDSLSITPTTSAQTITAPSGTDGYSPVNVAAVTASIDSNIQAGNIKKDVTILNVTGTYEGSGGGSSGTRYYAWEDSGLQLLYMTREENPTTNSTLYVYLENIMHSLAGTASITEVLSDSDAIIVNFSGTTGTGVRNSLKDLAIFYEPQPWS